MILPMEGLEGQIGDATFVDPWHRRHDMMRAWYRRELSYWRDLASRLQGAQDALTLQKEMRRLTDRLAATEALLMRKHAEVELFRTSDMASFIRAGEA